MGKWLLTRMALFGYRLAAGCCRAVSHLPSLKCLRSLETALPISLSFATSWHVNLRLQGSHMNLEVWSFFAATSLQRRCCVAQEE